MPRTPEEQDVTAIVAGLIERAATIGTFDPLTLLPACLGDKMQAVLTHLGRVCEEVLDRNEVLWRLKSEPRSEVLSRIDSRRKALRAVAETKPAASDAFGRELQAVLLGTGDGASASSAASRTQDEVLAARNFARMAPVARKSKAADPRPVRRAIAERDEQDRDRIVLAGTLHGRAAERRQIEEFMRGLKVRANRRLGDAEAPSTGALLITGTGGVGKSALLAAIMADARANPKMPPVVHIDFDRPTLFRGDRLEIVREITRQLGRQFPRWETPLAKVREALSAAIEQAGGQEGSLLLKLEVEALSLLREALAARRSRRLPDLRRTVVVLDTFEEMVVRGRDAFRGTDAARATLEWFKTLRLEGGLEHLRLIVSGRAAPDLGEDLSAWFDAHIDLGGLDEQAGARLLRDNAAELFSGQRGEEASRTFCGHPMSLRFLARYGREHPQEIDGLIKDGLASANEKFSAAFSQVFLYTRTLGRIRDEQVRALAHPGLVLRRVTPKLIAEVLAGPCGLGPLDAAGARDLFARLKQNAWIVDRTANSQVVEHRRDLRRLMLPAMMAPPTDAATADLRDKAFAIHRVAAEFYRDRRDDTGLDDAGQALEAFYHRACANPESVPDLETIMRFAPALGQDAENLPPRVRAVAKFGRGHGLSMSGEEIALLPDALARQVRREREENDLKEGRTNPSGRPIPTRAGGDAEPPPTTFTEAERRFGRDIETQWNEADFEAVSIVGERAYDRLWAEGSKEEVIALDRSASDPVFSAVWKSLLAGLVTGRWPAALTEGGFSSAKKSYSGAESPSAGKMTPYYLHCLALIIVNARGDRSDQNFIRAITSPLYNLVPPKVSTRLEFRAFTLIYPSEATRAHLRHSLIRTLGLAKQYADRDAQTSTFPNRDLRQMLREAVRENRRGLPLSDLLRRLSGFDELVPVEQLVGIDYDMAHSRPAHPAPTHIEGLLPEIYNPITTALRPLLADEDVMSRLTAEISRDAVLVPSDLDRLARSKLAARSGDRFLASLVEYADQCGQLARLMATAADCVPGDARIARVQTLVDRMETVFHAPFGSSRPGQATRSA